MKQMMIALVLIATSLTTFNANALEAASGVTTAASIGALLVYSTLCVSGCKETAELVDDTQNYYQTGEISLLLKEKMTTLQNLDNSLSDADAIDLIVKATKKSQEN